MHSTRKIEIRPARPSDADAAVPLIYSSGPAAFDFVFSHRTRIPATGFLHRALQTNGGEFGYGVHWVGVLDGRVVASGAAFAGDRPAAFLVAALRQIVGCYGVVQGLGVIRRGLQIEQVVKPPKPQEHYIGHLGVVPELRGQGIGRQMVEHLIELGRESKRPVAVLDVSVENPRAQALYERLGFAVTSEHESDLANAVGRVANHRRMEFPLEGGDR